MADPIWMSYAGIITGAIGAFTGIAGAALGYISYRRTGKIKALDLRLELRKTVNELRSTLESLAPLLQSARVSHRSVLSARGLSRSSAMDVWEAELEKDRKSIGILTSAVPDPSSSFDDLAYSALEAKLVEVHATQLKVSGLAEKYCASLASDDKQREQIAADYRARMQAMLGTEAKGK